MLAKPEREQLPSSHPASACPETSHCDAHIEETGGKGTRLGRLTPCPNTKNIGRPQAAGRLQCTIAESLQIMSPELLRRATR